MRTGAGSPLLGRHTRRGVTIIEVLFAIGIVIVGLLGVASLLPMAARNAELSNEAAEGQAYAQRYYAEFVSRGFSDSRNWRWFDDNPAMGNKTFSTAFNNAVDIPSSSNAGGNVSTAFRHAICIDPGFFADPLSVLEVNGSSFGANQAYRPGLFPYYQDSFDPTSNPFAPSFLAAPPALRNRPRLLRVSLHDPSSAFPVMPAKVVQRLFMSLDDLSITKPKDKSLPPQRVGEQALPNVVGRGLTQANYSWLATLSPREFGFGEMPLAVSEQYYTLSIVVMRRRDRSWFQPTSPDKNSIPQGERLLGVFPQSGNFIGGDGGQILVTASTGLSNTIRIGDWLMLSRFQSAGTARGVICRWYRVIGVDADPTLSGGPPATNWSRSLVLEGPDWVFDNALPTQATLLSNVVTVLERVIPVE